LLNAVSVAARKETNPQFNPTLRAAIDQAKESLVPNDKIESAISRASIASQNLEELLFEAYGPEGAAFLISVITDSRNRSVSEIKKILSDHGAKWAEQGSVRWGFEQVDGIWCAKFPLTISDRGQESLSGQFTDSAYLAVAGRSDGMEK